MTAQGEMTSAIRPPNVDRHLDDLRRALDRMRPEAYRLARWGTRLAGVLGGGGRLLIAGNGGSAAEAQHLASELVGRMCDDRRPLSAIALHAETSSLTAIADDYGFAEVYARQVRAHGRSGDVLLLLSTAGRSPNLLAAAAAGHERGMTVWSLTGPLPNPLADSSDEAFGIAARDPQAVQELHLVVTHLLCGYIDAALPHISAGPAPNGTGPHAAWPGVWR